MPGALRIAGYEVHEGGGRLVVTRRPGPLHRLGLCRRRPSLALSSGQAVAEVEVRRRRLRGSDVKRPFASRPWQVRVTGPSGEPLGRTLRVRTRPDAERLAGVVRRFAAGAGGPTRR